jgi:hypothetical protein
LLPDYAAPPSTPGSTVVIRNKLNGVVVKDAAVGGTISLPPNEGQFLCRGDDEYIWYHWGDANFANVGRFLIQNQVDVSDWPCFAKYYITFPLDSLPPGKVIQSAELLMYTWGGSDPTKAEASLVQVSSVKEDWNETTLTWNNAPLAQENYSQAHVNVVTPQNWPGWPGIPVKWDLARAVAKAYADGLPLRLVLYEADVAQHSGKYFVSSDDSDWNAVGRPTLTVKWGTPP